MERQLIVLAAALAGLYLVGRVFKAPARKKGLGWIEVADNTFAIRDAFGSYLRCEDADGNIIADKSCAGCGESIFGIKLGGCPGTDADDAELE